MLSTINNVNNTFASNHRKKRNDFRRLSEPFPNIACFEDFLSECNITETGTVHRVLCRHEGNYSYKVTLCFVGYRSFCYVFLILAYINHAPIFEFNHTNIVIHRRFT